MDIPVLRRRWLCLEDRQDAKPASDPAMVRNAAAADRRNGLLQLSERNQLSPNRSDLQAINTGADSAEPDDHQGEEQGVITQVVLRPSETRSEALSMTEQYNAKGYFDWLVVSLGRSVLCVGAACARTAADRLRPDCKVVQDVTVSEFLLSTCS